MNGIWRALMMLFCVTPVGAMFETRLETRKLLTAGAAKDLWCKNKYKIRYIPLSVIMNRFSSTTLDFDISSTFLRLSVAGHRNDIISVKTDRKVLPTEYGDITFLKQPVFDATLADTMSDFPKEFGKIYKNFFSYQMSTSTDFVRATNGIAAGRCSEIASRDFVHEQHDCVVLYDSTTKEPFILIPLALPMLSNGKSIALNTDGTMIAVLLYNKSIALISIQKPLIHVNAYYDVIVKCQV